MVKYFEAHLQRGFRPGKWSMDAVFIIRQFLEKIHSSMIDPHHFDYNENNWWGSPWCFQVIEPEKMHSTDEYLTTFGLKIIKSLLGQFLWDLKILSISFTKLPVACLIKKNPHQYVGTKPTSHYSAKMRREYIGCAFQSRRAKSCLSAYTSC